MRTLLLFLSLTVALGMPTFPSDGEQKPVAAEQNGPPVTGDWVPVQGHVVVEHPAPQLLLSPKEQRQQTAAAEHSQKEDEAELEDEEKPEVKDLRADPEAEVEEELKAEQEPAPVDEEAEVEPGAELDLMEEPDFKVESEVKVEVEGQPQDELEEEEDLLDPDFKVQSEVRVDADVMEADPEEAHVLHEAPETFQARVDVDREVDPGMEVEERHIDMEWKLQPSVESEPLDDDALAEEVSHTELSAEEMAFGDAAQQQDAAAERLPGEEEEEEEEDKVDGEEDFGEKKENGASDEQEIMELVPELTGEQNPEDVPDAAVLDEEPLDPAQQQQQAMPLSENYVPGEETGMEPYLRDEGAPEQFSEEPAMQEEGLPMMMEDDTYSQGGHYCPGMITGGKCYQFFRGPKKYEEAELFCQEHFSGGHLASITSQRVHQELVRLIQQRGGYTRTWVGGRRLDSHLFIWLDGSRWSYDDWLPGEPNHTANMENCLEVLGNGKFNDFTCWEPQAFVCSYPSQ
uniref:C-type lectin domain-containing protein 161-like n=1 Tax=Fundulus heteroclitus TaxID=8078 RepID=A0A3Q2PFP2_FUNHE